MPDYLSDAREKMSSAAGYQLVAATGQSTSRDQFLLQVVKPRNHPDAQLLKDVDAKCPFGPVKGISLSQVQGEDGIDAFAPSSSCSFQRTNDDLCDGLPRQFAVRTSNHQGTQ